MPRYIDADAINMSDISPVDGFSVFGATAEDIELTPTADVQPVIHAKWIDEREESLKCSNCKGWIYKPFIGGSNERTKHYGPNYCAFCGARMDGGGSRS